MSVFGRDHGFFLELQTYEVAEQIWKVFFVVAFLQYPANDCVECSNCCALFERTEGCGLRLQHCFDQVFLRLFGGSDNTGSAHVGAIASIDGSKVYDDEIVLFYSFVAGKGVDQQRSFAGCD